VLNVSGVDSESIGGFPKCVAVPDHPYSKFRVKVASQNWRKQKKKYHI
jgi:hypothetical protein